MNVCPRLLAKCLLVVTLLCGLPTVLAAEEYSAKGADTCLMCHRSAKWAVMDIFKTKHGSRTDPDAPFAKLQCESCHGPSNAHVKAKKKSEVQPKVSFGDNDQASVPQQNEMCLGCHSNHPNLGWMGSAHENADVGCVSCHDVHVERDPMLDPVTQSETCYGCHQRVRSDSYKAYSHPVRFGSMTCSSCHNPHDGNSEFLLKADNVNDTCYSCHAEKRGPFLWEHAPVTESCSNCHRPHGSNHVAMLTRRPPLLCQACHSAAGHPGDPYTSEDFEEVPENRFMLSRSCMNCHYQVHGSNHPSGSTQMR